MLLTGIGLASCGGSGQSVSHARTSATTIPSDVAGNSPSATNDVYTASELRAVEIDNTDLPGFTQTDSSTSDAAPSRTLSPTAKASDASLGCKSLDDLGAGKVGNVREGSEGGVSFESHDERAGKYVALEEMLVSESATFLGGDLRLAADAFSRCHNVQLADVPGGNLNVSPASFPGGASGVRLDGIFSQRKVAGYLLIEKVRPTVAMFFGYFEVGVSDPSHQAYTLFDQARQRATLLLPS
jgi:hypothetical protein